MHMSDALLSPAVAVTMYALSGTAIAKSIQEVKKEEDIKKIPTMAVTAAMVFAGQMINYTIPGTGSSGHICGGMLLSSILGPFAGFLSMVVILTVQCLFFADGGLMALGANCWNMAFYGCFVGYYLFWQPMRRAGLDVTDRNRSRRRIILASVLGCIITLQMGAFSVVLETGFSGVTELPFVPFLLLMQPIHLLIGLVEGIITSAILLFIFDARPELLQLDNRGNKSKYSYVGILVLLSLVALFVGGFVSNYASSNPDGLEWALFGNADDGYKANLGLDEEQYGIDSMLAQNAQKIQDKTAMLPDYSFAENDSATGTSVSGIVGSMVVVFLAIAISLLGGFFKGNREKHAKYKTSN